MIWVSRPRKRSTLAASHGVEGSGPRPRPGLELELGLGLGKGDSGVDADDDPGADPGGKVARILAVEEGYARPCWMRRTSELE